MKKLFYVAVATLSLVGCEKPASKPINTENVVVIVDDECPRADNQPCK